MLDNRIHSIALIGARNNPLYVRNFASGAPSSSSSAAGSIGGSIGAGYDAQAAAAGELKTNYIAHSALDVVEERTAGKQQEQYLGLLFTIEDVAVYGFQTSTRLKIIVMLLLSDQIVKDIDMITISRAIHNCYLAYLADPFNDLPSSLSKLPRSEVGMAVSARPIRSKRFDKHMELIAGFS